MNASAVDITTCAMRIIHGAVFSVTIVSDQSTPLTTMLPGTSSGVGPNRS